MKKNLELSKQVHALTEKEKKWKNQERKDVSNEWKDPTKARIKFSYPETI